MRKVGDIYLDLEKNYDELVNDHGMQMGDMLYWLYGHLKIHFECIEEYSKDGSNPVFKYGPGPDKKAIKRKLLKKLKTWEDCRLDSKCADQIMTLFNKEYL